MARYLIFLWYLAKIIYSIKLSQSAIRQIIIGHHSDEAGDGTDGIIPDRVSLAHAFLHDHLPHKGFLQWSGLDHNGPLPSQWEKQLDEEIEKFLAS